MPFSRIDCGKRLQLVLGEATARLERARCEQLDRHCLDSSARAACLGLLGFALANSAERPRPSAAARLFAHLGEASMRELLAPQHLGGELDVGLRPGAAMVVEQHRLAVRRRLGHPHVARDHRVVDLLAEMPAHIGGDLLAEIVAAVVHGQHDALDLQASG